MPLISDLKKTIGLLFTERLSKVRPDSALAGKVILLTGGSKGLGKTMSTYLTESGCVVVSLSRSFKLTFDEQLSLNKNLYEVKFDLLKTEGLEKLVLQIYKKFGKIDVLINNAAEIEDVSIEKLNLEKISSAYKLNVFVPMILSSLVSGYMKKNKDGIIINIGSKISHNSAVSGSKSIYASTKYALEGMSLAMRRELAGSGVRVCCIMPGTLANFMSIKTGNYLLPSRLAQIVGMVIMYSDVDFESIILKSSSQDI